MSANMTRIERADGRLFQVRAEDLKGFLKDNPGSKIVKGFAPSDEPSPAEVEATRVVSLPRGRGRRGAGKGVTVGVVDDVAQDATVNVENGSTTDTSADEGADASNGTATDDDENAPD